MLHGKPVRIEVAAGLDEQTLGTDAVAIKAAIERVAGPAGVVVLIDLGSAVLSAELALELLDDPDCETASCCRPAPLVEGLVVAAVAAAGGADRFEVAAEARNALLGKAGQLTGDGISRGAGIGRVTTARPRSAGPTGPAAEARRRTGRGGGRLHRRQPARPACPPGGPAGR